MTKLVHRQRTSLGPMTGALTYPPSDWRAFVNQRLVRPAERAGLRGDYKAVELVALYYLNLQLWRRAVACGDGAAARGAEFDVDTSEMLLRRFASDRAQTPPPKPTPPRRRQVAPTMIEQPEPQYQNM